MLNQKRKLKTGINIKQVPRPVKIAYLISEDKNEHLILDAIFDEAYLRWGGRDTLLVPIQEDKISEKYMQWLATFDPDLIYSYTKLSEEKIKQIHKKTHPIIFFQHDFKRDNYRPNLHYRFLEAVSILPQVLVNDYSLKSRSELSIINAYDSWKDEGFFRNNFGVNDSIKRLEKSYELLTLIPPGLNQRIHIPGKGINSYPELFKTIKRSSFLTAAQLSAYGYRAPLEIYDHEWSDNLNLFIGDSFKDRLFFWNARMLRRERYSLEIPTLYLPTSYLKNDDFLKEFFEFIHDHDNVFFGNSRNNPIIRSYSLDDKQLEEALQIVNKYNNKYSNFRKGKAKEPLPNEYNSYSGPRSGNRTLIYESPSEIQPGLPNHFEFLNPDQNDFKLGAYLIDLSINRESLENGEEWILPRHMGINDLFVNLPSKINKLNRISCIYNYYENSLLHQIPRQHSDLLKITIPEDLEVFKTLMKNYLKVHMKLDIRYQEVSLSRRYSDIDFSDKGRSLLGALHLFDGLNNLYGILKNKFWREFFDYFKTGKNNQKNDNAVAGIFRSLKDKFNNFNLDNDEKIEVLAKHILKMDKALPKGSGKVLFKEIIELKKTDLKIKKDEEISKEILDELKEEISWLARQNILHQGYVWQCNYCNSNNWESVADLKFENACKTCANKHRIGADKTEWSYKLNGRIDEALNRHSSVLLEALTLGYFQEKATFFTHIVQSDFYENHSQKCNDFEIDIIFSSDGKFFLGEAKPTLSSFKKFYDNILKKINRIEPDVFIFSFQKRDRANINDLKEKIKSMGVEVQEFCLEEKLK